MFFLILTSIHNLTLPRLTLISEWLLTLLSNPVQRNPDIRELSGPGEEVSYFRVWSILYTLTQALIWDQRKYLLSEFLLYQGLLYPGYQYKPNTFFYENTR